MPFNRRKILKSLGALAAVSMIGNESQAAIETTPQENEAIAMMAARNVQNFVMLNKTRGQMLIIMNRRISQVFNALSGRLSGDAPRENFGVTPSGIFLLNSYGNNRNIGFYLTNNVIDYSIHTVANVPGQQRDKRLKSTISEFKRISSGCVNVDQSTIDALLKFMEGDGVQSFRPEDTTSPWYKGTFFLVLPESGSVAPLFNKPAFIEQINGPALR